MVHFEAIELNRTAAEYALFVVILINYFLPITPLTSSRWQMSFQRISDPQIGPLIPKNLHFRFPWMLQNLKKKQ